MDKSYAANMIVTVPSILVSSDDEIALKIENIISERYVGMIDHEKQHAVFTGVLAQRYIRYAIKLKEHIEQNNTIPKEFNELYISLNIIEGKHGLIGWLSLNGFYLSIYNTYNHNLEKIDINIDEYYDAERLRMKELMDKANDTQNIFENGAKKIARNNTIGLLDSEPTKAYHDDTSKKCKNPLEIADDPKRWSYVCGNDVTCNDESNSDSYHRFGRMYCDNIDDNSPTINLEIGKMKKYIFIGTNGVYIANNEALSNILPIINISKNGNYENSFYMVDSESDVNREIIDKLTILGFNEIGSNSVVIMEKSCSYSLFSLLYHIKDSHLSNTPYDFNNIGSDTISDDFDKPVELDDNDEETSLDWS